MHLYSENHTPGQAFGKRSGVIKSRNGHVICLRHSKYCCFDQIISNYLIIFFELDEIDCRLTKRNAQVGFTWIYKIDCSDLVSGLVLTYWLFSWTQKQSLICLF